MKKYCKQIFILSNQYDINSVKDTCIQLINLVKTDSSSTDKQTESMNTVLIPPTTTVSIHSNISNDKETHPVYVKTHKIATNFILSLISRRLAVRKQLNNRLCRLSDIMCFLGVFGIILMTIVNEIGFNQIDDEYAKLSWFIKLTITLSTIVLIGLILYYHRIDINLYSVNNSINDCHFTITYTKIFLIAIEILVCAIHPIPHSFPLHSNTSLENISSNSTVSTHDTFSSMAGDILLGLPMFARLYLFGRVIMFHSHLFRDVSLRSIGYLNKVSINFFFLMKTHLERFPTIWLTAFCVILCIIGSWCLRACSYLPNNQHLSVLDAMWLFIVTFSTVGYGDLVPSSYCGRSIAAIIGLVGVFSTALVIAVLAQMLLLDRWEKYVHNFALQAELEKDRKSQAANVVKFTVKIWYLRKKHRSGLSIQHLQAQRQLFNAIDSLQLIKHKQRKLIDRCVDQIDIITLQRTASDKTYEVTRQLTFLKAKIDNIEEKLVDMNININNTMNDIQKTLHILLDKVAK
ncbi:unnamed protein product [Rotaria sp. Silwood1]|nr:unnamed protein product [Rotaria sp. Silwood1]CAF3688541.1 unnamed protein product [Rotaria sp. Silwood1]CAF4852078.1 unnamed protein product [Rotaria sp. Silwood1]CAF4923445.1 unnamed protein product [Rotaria sp. Silwood1]